MKLVQQINVFRLNLPGIFARNQSVTAEDLTDYLFSQFILQSNYICDYISSKCLVHRTCTAEGKHCLIAFKSAASSSDPSQFLRFGTTNIFAKLTLKMGEKSVVRRIQTIPI